MATNIYVQKKSDVSRMMDEFTAHGYTCYRTRLLCECPAPRNRRSGAVLISQKGMHEYNVIRCKGCAGVCQPNTSDTSTGSVSDTKGGDYGLN